MLKKVRRIKKNGEMKIKNSLIKPIKKSIITWIVGGIVLLIVWCCDIKKILLYIPGIRNFVLNLNFITSIFTNYYTVIIGALFLVVILYLRNYADVKVPSISIAGIEFNLKNLTRINFHINFMRVRFLCFLILFYDTITLSLAQLLGPFYLQFLPELNLLLLSKTY